MCINLQNLKYGEQCMKYKIINFQTKGDDRGSLVVLENNKEIPIQTKRIYHIFGTKPGVRRGYHAHKNLKQLAIAVSGSCKFYLDDGHEKEVIELNSPNIGLLIEDMIWREMFDFSPDCVLLVLADDFYNEDDYIRSYENFISEVNKLGMEH